MKRFIEDGIASLEYTYSELHYILDGLQILILLDLFHAPFGLWGPSDIPLLKRLYCKVGRRTEFYITILLAPELHSYKIFNLVFVTWVMTDVCRYPFYALSCIGVKPRFIVWMRYSIFIIQYPLVVITETCTNIIALQFLFQKGFFKYDIQYGSFEYSFALINYGYYILRATILNLRKFKSHYNVLLVNRKKKLYPQTIKKE